MKRTFPTDARLTTIAIGYRNTAAALIYKQALPPIPIFSQRFKWYDYPVEESFTLPDIRVGRKGRLNEVEFTAVEEESEVFDYGLDDLIPNSNLNEADSIRAANNNIGPDPRASATINLTHLVQLSREVRTAKVVQDPNNFTPARRIALAGSRCSVPAFDGLGLG